MEKEGKGRRDEKKELRSVVMERREEIDKSYKYEEEIEEEKKGEEEIEVKEGVMIEGYWKISYEIDKSKMI